MTYELQTAFPGQYDITDDEDECIIIKMIKEKYHERGIGHFEFSHGVFLECHYQNFLLPENKLVEYVIKINLYK